MLLRHIYTQLQESDVFQLQRLVEQRLTAIHVDSDDVSSYYDGDIELLLGNSVLRIFEGHKGIAVQFGTLDTVPQWETQQVDDVTFAPSDLTAVSGFRHIRNRLIVSISVVVERGLFGRGLNEGITGATFDLGLQRWLLVENFLRDAGVSRDRIRMIAPETLSQGQFRLVNVLQIRTQPG